MIELTLDQVRALAQAVEPRTVIDPTTQKIYTLVPTDSQLETPLETPVEPWKYLVFRRHAWRKQLSIKGRNMTVRQFLSTVEASNFTAEQAAEDLDLPVEAVQEALAYAEQNAELLAFETAYERLRLAQRGERLGPQSLPG